MTLANSVLHNIFPLHTKIQNYPSIKYPKCYPECHNVNKFSLEKATDVDE